MKAIVALACSAWLSAGAAAAQALDTFADLRARYEHADADDLPEGSDAVSLRLRTGFEAVLSDRFTLLAEGEVGASAGEFDDGEGAPEQRPVIADPDFAGLNRLALTWRPAERARVTLGRQRVVLDDERFVGALGFRQDDRTLDAARAVVRPGGGAVVDATWLGGASRPLRPRGRARWLRGEGYLLNASLLTPAGTLTVFRYALDLDADGFVVPGGETLTDGGRLAGARGPVRWTASYARQAEWGGADRALDLRYAAGSLGWFGDDLDVSVAAETLGGDGVTGFLTLLGTNHAFQGTADLFLVTPPDGVADLNAGGVWRLGEAGPVRGIALSARAHRFEAARGGASYGHEVDLRLSGRVGANAVSAELARYEADGFGADTTRVWLTLARRF